MRISVVLIGGGLLIGSAATAQDIGAADPQEQMQACALLESDKARLACFDAVMSGSDEVQEEVREAQQIEARENFGLTETQRREQSSRKPDKPFVPDDVSIQATVADFRKGAFDSVTLLLDNGQVWRSTNAGNLRHSFKIGDRVTLREGAISGYRLRVEGKNGVLGVERVR